MFDFDRIISRKNTHALTADNYRGYIWNNAPGLTFDWPEEDFIHMWVADMSFATPRAVTDEIRNRLEREILGYTLSAHTHGDYVSAVTAWCKTHYDVDLDASQLRSCEGIVPAVNALTALNCGEGDTILNLTPSYGMFRHAATASGATLLDCTLIYEDGRWSVDWDGFTAMAQTPECKVFLLCNPHNPTGRCWTREELVRFGDICQENGLFMVVDEIHCDLLRQGKRHVSALSVYQGRSDFAVCFAPSKTFNMAGLHISNVVIPDETLRKRWKGSVQNPLSIAGGLGAYTNGAPWLDELRTYLDGNFQLLESMLSQHLPLCQYRIPDATYLAWVNLNPYLKEDVHLSTFFANKAGVLLEGGDELFIADAQGWVRLNLSCPRSLVEAGIGRIIDALK